MKQTSPNFWPKTPKDLHLENSRLPSLREKALLDTASKKNGPIEAVFWRSEKSRALIRTTFGPFGPQNRNFGPNGTEREKRQYWLAEDAVGSELLSALTGKFTGRSDAL